MYLLTTELTLNDLQRLHQIAVSSCNRSEMKQCNWLYRNRWKSYFNDIFTNHGGIMAAYAKDNSGDRASPMNGQINGLFFMAKNIKGKPPWDSPFGEVRIQIPAKVLLGMAPNLYFADFYCMSGKTHYVTLVMTRPGSATDNYCREKLLPLSHGDNPFLFLQDSHWMVNVKRHILVELLYTEDIDINELRNTHGAVLRKRIPRSPNCRGRSKPGGKPKNSKCTKCNLPPSPASFRFETF